MALENEQNDNEGNGELDLLFLNYLSDNYPNMVVNGVINSTEAILITDLNLDGLGLNNIDGIEHFTNLESLSCKNNNLTSIPDLPNQLETLNLRSNNISQINPLPESLLDVDLRNNSLATVPEFPNQIETLKLCFNNFRISLIYLIVYGFCILLIIIWWVYLLYHQILNKFFVIIIKSKILSLFQNL